MNNIDLQYDSPKRRMVLAGVALAIVALIIGLAVFFSAQKKKSAEIPVNVTLVDVNNKANVANGVYTKLTIPIKVGVADSLRTVVYNAGDRICCISQNVLAEIEGGDVQVVRNEDNTVSFGPVVLGKFQINQIVASVVEQPDVFSIGGKYLERVFEKVKLREKDRVLILSDIKDRVLGVNLDELKELVDDGKNKLLKGKVDWPSAGKDPDGKDKEGLPGGVVPLVVLLAGFILAQVLRVRSGLIVSVGWFDTAMIIGGAVMLALYYIIGDAGSPVPALMVIALLLWGVSLVMSIMANFPNVIFIALSIVAKLFLFYLATLGMGFLICVVLVWLLFSFIAHVNV